MNSPEPGFPGEMELVICALPSPRTWARSVHSLTGSIFMTAEGPSTEGPCPQRGAGVGKNVWWRGCKL